VRKSRIFVDVLTNTLKYLALVVETEYLLSDLRDEAVNRLVAVDQNDLWMGRLDHDGEHFATSAQLVLDFAGDWQEGVAFSGSYVLEGDFPSVEGSFDGHYCEIEVMCG
jgi:hypothetical protein